MVRTSHCQCDSGGSIPLCGSINRDLGLIQKYQAFFITYIAISNGETALLF